MAALLTYSQQASIKAISANNESQYAQIEKEVEDQELLRLLGPAFLYAIQTTPANYANILDAKSYTNGDNETVQHKGIRYVIAYMVYSRYLGISFVADTFSGFVQKTRQDSEALSEGAIRRLQEDNRMIAMTAWDGIREYMDLNYEDYPLWKTTYKKVYRPRIYGTRKVNYGR
jgi:hypothetical protein